MPFNSANAAAIGAKGGRKSRGDKDPASIRNKSIIAKVSQTEYDFIRDKAVACNMSKTELIVQSVKVYEPTALTR